MVEWRKSEYRISGVRSPLAAQAESRTRNRKVAGVTRVIESLGEFEYEKKGGFAFNISTLNPLLPLLVSDKSNSPSAKRKIRGAVYKKKGDLPLVSHLQRILIVAISIR